MRNRQLIVVILLLIITFCSAFTFSLPEIQISQASVIYDNNGKVIAGLGLENRENVSLAEISPQFIKAIIAVEDKNFYKHHGIDFGGLLRAIFVNIKNRKIVAGGSTITQQTAKNLFLTNDRTFSRKLKEFIYAIQLERKYSKDEILSFYCNSIYFGQGAYGVEVAARTFFGVESSDLSLAQSALLAGLPQSPNNYDPYSNSELAKKRQSIVLQRMLEEEKITAKEKGEALAEQLDYQQGNIEKEASAPYFVAMVREYLRGKYGDDMVYQGGMKVYTSLDMDMQRAAQQAYQKGLEGRDQDLQVALVALDIKNGQIKALVGGRDYYKSQFNRAFAPRQPGSTFKPFVYSLAIEKGLTSADMMMCEEVEFELPNGDVYRPTDWDQDEPYHWREFTLKEAVMVSDNVIAVRLNDHLGPNNSARHVETFGFQNISPILSLPLGSIEVSPVELATAYSVFANQGIYSEPYFINRVVDNKGKVLEENLSKQHKVISSENAYIITNIMTGVLEKGGTGWRLKERVGRIAAGKTGTTDNLNDAWFVGYTPQLCCAVWIGYDRDRAANLYGGSSAGPIWADFIREASSKLPEMDFSKPDKVNVLNICLDSGLVASEYCPRQIDMAFTEGSEPEEICYYHLPAGDWLEEGAAELDTLPEKKEKRKWIFDVWD